MRIKLIGIVLLTITYLGCKQQDNHEESEHAEHDHEHAEHEHEEEHEDEKLFYTEYDNNYELFVETDPFIVDEDAVITAFVTVLPDFKPLENAKIRVSIIVDGENVAETGELFIEHGILSFNLQPLSGGNGSIKFEIETSKNKSEIVLQDIEVYSEHEEAHEALEHHEHHEVNTCTFTKSQSWKIDFATEHPTNEAFGKIIKTMARVESARGEESVVIAKTSGIILFSNNEFVEGVKVEKGQKLLSISSNELSENNLSVKLAEAKSNYETSKINFERESALVKDKIISEHEFLDAKNQYETAKAIYENLIENFNESGQNVDGTITGYVKNIYVENGQYVEAGQALISISQNKNLLLTVQVQQKYAALLPSIVSANIKSPDNEKIYSFDQLNGKILSFGKSTTENSYMIPVSLQIENKKGFTPGTFVEVYLKTVTNSNALTLPNTSFMEEQGVYYVFVQDNPELFEKREVKIGNTDGIRTEVIQGISAEERIVTEGATQIKLAQATGALDPHSGHVH